MTQWWQWVAGTGLVLTLLALCACRPMAPESQEPNGVTPAQPPQVILADDLDRASLELALQRSLDYVRRLPSTRLLPFATRQITAETLRDTLETFQRILDQAATPAALHAALHAQFNLIQASGRTGQGDVLFTGYYEALLPGSLVRTTEFTYPLYGPPDDLLHIELQRFRPDWVSEQLTARYDKGQILPYFTRREIDVEGKLRGRGLELVWLPDAVDGFFLHIQGSGRIRLPDGRLIRVHYAGSNGHPYRSIGTLLLNEGRLSPETMSLQRLQHYLRTHPEEHPRVFNHNPRYIFFRQVDRGPIGSLGLTLIPGRSIAIDSRLFPPAGLAFVQTRQPVLNAANEVTGWQPLSRFVFAHDTGSAITGPGRVDLFWGSGERAEAAAGRIKHQGTLFFLLKRSAVSPQP